VLCPGVGVRAGPSRDQEAAPRRLRHVNLVHADAVPRHYAELRRRVHDRARHAALCVTQRGHTSVESETFNGMDETG